MRKLLALTLVGVLGFVACDTSTGESDEETTTTTESDPRPERPTTTTTVATDTTVEDAAVTNARRTAESYLEYTAFSRSGLIKQLEFEGYTTAAATVAVDSLDVDWNDQAVKSAKNYLELQGFSHSGLVNQLEFEGYTPEQAEHGATAAGV